MNRCKTLAIAASAAVVALMASSQSKAQTFLYSYEANDLPQAPSVDPTQPQWNKVLDSGDHQRTGTEDNDELLGHHGDDTVIGLEGKDVLWGDWELKGNGSNQSDTLRGGDGNDFLYPSHGKNNMYGGAGNDRIIAYYGHGLIDCGPGNKDYAQTRWQRDDYRVRNCETIKHFCAFGESRELVPYGSGDKASRLRLAVSADQPVADRANVAVQVSLLVDLQLDEHQQWIEPLAVQEAAGLIVQPEMQADDV